MGRRSKVGGLPTDLIEELNRRLVANGFGDYEALADWLAEQGHAISKSSLHRHGSQLEAEFEAAMGRARSMQALARATRESGDTDASLMGAASEILQDNLLRISLAVDRAALNPAEGAKILSQVARAFADVGRFDLSLRRFQDEQKAKMQGIDAELESGRLTPEAALARVRDEIYGIA